jgi:hypothetical protein
MGAEMGHVPRDRNARLRILKFLSQEASRRREPPGRIGHVSADPLLPIRRFPISGLLARTTATHFKVAFRHT